ncbi:MAG: hypothetical protein NTW87_16835 [Planctomycetota bacterium]|nr:hypothetical protein [Planctomycetota bacterium]
MAGILLVFIVVIGIIGYLEGCFTAIPVAHHKIPRHLVWLIEVPVLLAFFYEAAQQAGFYLFPVVLLLTNTAINWIICLGLILSFRSYFKELGITGHHILWAFLASLAVCLWPVCLLALAALAVIWLAMHPGEPVPEWIKIVESPTTTFVVPALLFLMFLAAMGTLKQVAAAAVQRQKQLAKAAARRNAARPAP